MSMVVSTLERNLVKQELPCHLASPADRGFFKRPDIYHQGHKSQSARKGKHPKQQNMYGIRASFIRLWTWSVEEWGALTKFDYVS